MKGQRASTAARTADAVAAPMPFSSHNAFIAPITSPESTRQAYTWGAEGTPASPDQQRWGAQGEGQEFLEKRRPRLTAQLELEGRRTKLLERGL